MGNHDSYSDCSRAAIHFCNASFRNMHRLPILTNGTGTSWRARLRDLSNSYNCGGVKFRSVLACSKLSSKGSM